MPRPWRVLSDPVRTKQRRAAKPAARRRHSRINPEYVSVILPREHFFQRGNTGYTTVLLSGKPGSRAGKTDDPGQLVFGEFGRMFVQLEQAAHGAAAENIPRAGSVCHVYPRQAGHSHADVSGGGVAALGTKRRVHQGYSVLIQQFFGALLRVQVPHIPRNEYHPVVG